MDQRCVRHEEIFSVCDSVVSTEHRNLKTAWRARDVNVSLASHLSNLPTIATEASTSNLMVLSSVVISKTGASMESCPGIPRTGGQLGTGYVRIPFFTVGD